jgi:hypothetical protein
MASCGIVSSSTLADAQIHIEPDETVQNEPPSSGILDEPSSKIVPNTQRPVFLRNAIRFAHRDFAASFSSAAVKQEQRIRFDCLRRVASPQRAFRRFDRRPDPLHRVVG